MHRACSAALVKVQAAVVLLPSRPTRLSSTTAQLDHDMARETPASFLSLGPDRDAGETVEWQVAVRVDLCHVLS